MSKRVFMILLLWLAASWGYYIESFDADIAVYSTATIKVVERITVDFEDERRHGIYRDITYKYKTKAGNKLNLRLVVESVTDGGGIKRPYKLMKHGQDKRIRIGDPKKYTMGKQIYVITYTVQRAINFFDNHDELWWEVTGQNWECAIHSVTATVHLPPKTDLDGVTATCYSGTYGSTEQDCQWMLFSGGVKFSAGYLHPGEGLSAVVGIPKGVLTKPSAMAAICWFLRDNWIWILCFPIPFLVLLFLFVKWLRHGRDPMQSASVMVRYEPPEDLSPAEMGTVMDERADISDITATIIDMAVRGFVKIVETKAKKLLFFKKNDYGIVLIKSYDDADELSAFEKQFLRGLFSVGNSKGKKAADLDVPEGIEVIFISTLKDKFYTKLKSLKSKLYSTLVKRKYFPHNPETVRGKYMAAGIVLGAVGIFFAAFIHSFALAWALIPSALFYIFFSPVMPRKTKKGAAATLHAKGFEEFVRRAEKDRIKKLAADDPTIFERLLPYAMVLGCADQWVEKFSDIFAEPPNWYVGPRGMTSFYFVDGLGRAMETMGSSMACRPRGSGASGGGSGFSGGFSGGGFGGGGGGAW